MTHDLYVMVSFRFNGGSRLLNVSSLSCDVNPYEHNDFVSDSMELQDVQNQLKMPCVRFDLDVALPVLIFADKRCDSASVPIPNGGTPALNTSRAVSVPAGRLIACLQQQRNHRRVLTFCFLRLRRR